MEERERAAARKLWHKVVNGCDGGHGVIIVRDNSRHIRRLEFAELDHKKLTSYC